MRKFVFFITSVYRPSLVQNLVYMLQQVEYRPGPFVDWLLDRVAQLQPMQQVMHRKSLDRTKRAWLLIISGWVTIILWIAICFGSYLVWDKPYYVLGAVLTPVILILGLTVFVWLGYVIVARPDEIRQIALSKDLLAKHRGAKLAILGSYGKTTMKEVLCTVLGEGLNVAATPGNGNTPLAHAKFISSLNGHEDVLIFEIGEGKPGDILQFADTIKPDIAIVTGAAPNHLDQYKTVDSLLQDLSTIRKFVSANKLYWASESSLLATILTKEDLVYSQNGGNGWKIEDIKVGPDGLSMSCRTKLREYNLESGLLGKHQVGPLGLAVILSEKFELSKEQIEAGIRKTKAFQHRMQPYLLHGATIIDDTYNGNLEGILAGLELLAELKATRKIYVTPGLVDQGIESDNVHRQIARKIAQIKPTKLILMKNSSTIIILNELKKLGYKGDLFVETQPLEFYKNLDQFVCAGDVVLMQNDWTDNYR